MPQKRRELPGELPDGKKGYTESEIREWQPLFNYLLWVEQNEPHATQSMVKKAWDLWRERLWKSGLVKS